MQPLPLQGDVQHWVAALDHFDQFFDECTQQRADVRLALPDAAPDPPFPVEATLAVLRATAVILENCGNKSLYASHEVCAHGRVQCGWGCWRAVHM